MIVLFLFCKVNHLYLNKRRFSGKTFPASRKSGTFPVRFAQNARKAESRTMMQPPPFGTYERMCVSVCRNAYAIQTGCLPVWRRINGAGDSAASFSQQFLYHRVDILFFVLIYSATMFPFLSMRYFVGRKCMAYRSEMSLVWSMPSTPFDRSHFIPRSTW